MEMRRRWISDRRVLCALLVLVMFAGSAYPQMFGKNKVQYQDFDWRYLQSKHFDVYYYGDGKRLAEFTADVAESSYVSLKTDLNFEITKRIPFVVYGSHNDFEQTNVTASILEESVEGLTEIFKSRVVVQFKGDYNAYRNLVHHELTHAYMFQMVYAGGMGSMVTAMARFQLPLWVWEGMAEYQSIGWDTDADMYMRDATINGYLPPVEYLYGFFAYKGGQSLFQYIADKYGKQKVGELLNKFRMNRGVENGLKNAIGVGTEDLTKRWHKYLKKTYWPDIEKRDEPEDIAKKLTDHVKDRNFINNSPALSPRGDKLVYLSNKSDFMDIYMMSAIDGKPMGKLVRGGRSDVFEELHWDRPGIGWSPDGKRIVLAAKFGPEDALFIVDVEKKKTVRSYTFDLDGIFSPSWSPDGEKIVFMGNQAGHSDLYLFSLQDESLKSLTDDPFSDLDPMWSPNGEEIAFVSDRGPYLSGIGDDFLMQNHNFHQVDLYTIDVATGRITRYTDDEAMQKSPVFSPDGKYIAYVSDDNGINNIYMMNRDSLQSYPITNLLTGVSQISWSPEGSRLAFASFYNGGFDIFILNNPLEIEPGSVTLRKTAFLEKRDKEAKLAAAQIETPLMKPVMGEEDRTYKNFVFGDDFRRKRGEKANLANTFLEEQEYKQLDGSYKPKKYKIRFSPDIVTGGAGYSQFFGLQGNSMIVLSDILGNHQMNIYTDLFYNLKNSTFQFAYYYLPKRIDLGVSAFHYSYLYYTYYSDGFYLNPAFLRDRYYGGSVMASRPFDRFRRIDLGLTFFGIERDYGQIDPYAYYYGYSNDLFQNEENIYRRRIMLLNAAYKTDTVVWGMTGPVNGGRSNFTFSYSPMVSQRYGLDFWTFRADWRKYIRVRKDFTFAFRFAGGVSGGKHPQRFLLGGMMGWINYQYQRVTQEIWGTDMFYFSSFETPLRGFPYYEMIGTQFFLSNIEIRVPLIRYLILGFPLPLNFQNIRGVVFLDIGSAWNDADATYPFGGRVLGLPRQEDIRAGYGFGARVNLGFLLLKYDLAWGTDFSTQYKPVHYFTLGAEF